MAANSFDVIVVGAGNAAFCAAMAAREKGASVLVLERAPEDENGGNSRFTAGAFRVALDIGASPYGNWSGWSRH